MSLAIPRLSQLTMAFFVVKHLSDLKGDVCLLKGTGKVLDAGNLGSDADDGMGVNSLDRVSTIERARFSRSLSSISSGTSLTRAMSVSLMLMTKSLCLSGEKLLNHFINRNVVAAYDADEHDNAGNFRNEMKLAGLKINVARENVVENDVLISWHGRAFRRNTV